ncbi:HAD-like domain-containing protein [Rostrohypoxylon terebratum]|nr:HAD-like domain-containing protein [Rostrohypoxylon terebratum]
MRCNLHSTVLNTSAPLSRRFTAPLPNYVQSQTRNYHPHQRRGRTKKNPHYTNPFKLFPRLTRYEKSIEEYKEKSLNLQKDLLAKAVSKVIQDRLGQPKKPENLEPKDKDTESEDMDSRGVVPRDTDRNGSPSEQTESSKWMYNEVRFGIEQAINRAKHPQARYIGPYYSPEYVTLPFFREYSTKEKPKRRPEVVTNDPSKPRKHVEPSEKSGGIPDPSPEYLTYASYPPFILPAPRVILLVIDLNGTLLFRPSRAQPKKFVARPYARPFLAYCLRTFKVVFWSSAKIENVAAMVGQLVASQQYKDVVAIMGREHFGLTVDDYMKRVVCYKRLKTVWKNAVIQASHPEAQLGKCWDQTNTVLIDDSLEKGRSEPHNIIQIPEFKGDLQEKGFVLPQIHDYLNELSRQANVSSYIRQSPFALQETFSLTPEHMGGVTKLGWENGHKELKWGST